MDSLPFSRRNTRSRPIPPPESQPPLSSNTFSTPLNPQNLVQRQIHSGLIKHPQLKTNTKCVDARMSQIHRNRANLFSEYGSTHSIDFSLPSPVYGNTRHTSNPVDYDTTWISHPDSSTSLCAKPAETFQTSFLKSPVADVDSVERSSYEKVKLDLLREKINGFNHEVESTEKLNALKHEARLNGIRKERENYLKALEARQRIEKIHGFE